MNGTGENPTRGGVVSEWNAEARAAFRKAPAIGRHNLHERPEFSDAALAALIDRHPRELTDFCTMGDDPSDNDSWRGGDPGNYSGAELLDAVRKGRLWINLRRAMSGDAAYSPLFEAMFADLKRLNPGYRTLNAESGILISSPTAQVFIHSDPSETILWHVRGRKRIRLYPARPPFVEDAHLEAILHKEIAEDLPYHAWYEDHCAVVDLEPGMFVSWPLHGPHRVQNLEGMNVSVTCEIVTPESMLRNGVLYQNGFMRRRFGIAPRTSSTQGVQAYVKLALSRIAKVMAPKNRPMPRSERTFDVDPDAPTGFRDRNAA